MSWRFVSFKSSLALHFSGACSSEGMAEVAEHCTFSCSAQCLSSTQPGANPAVSVPNFLTPAAIVIYRTEPNLPIRYLCCAFYDIRQCPRAEEVQKIASTKEAAPRVSVMFVNRGDKGQKWQRPSARDIASHAGTSDQQLRAGDSKEDDNEEIPAQISSQVLMTPPPNLSQTHSTPEPDTELSLSEGRSGHMISNSANEKEGSKT